MKGDKHWSKNQLEIRESSRLFDLALLRAARLTYRAYLEVNCDRMQRPLGVVVNTVNCRGQLIFSSRPILLPDECYVPFEQIESQLY
ncbi:hypothetical protein BCD67_07825 [Oscillatoriales cyanobacterium USR001]|nr:hypothetical protein BCD67_07825 [Oscillatoriales cyanobacterium USR001]